mmetsp:Transcript_41217/g.83085  ORF Transcript_41217/g.83085 Transcript_41217/m.83085 type:complete len:171 (-) Transcript_41217:86-598(-)
MQAECPQFMQGDAKPDVDMTCENDSDAGSAADREESDREDDLDVDYEDFWAGANSGVPVVERHDLAKECVVGDRRVSSESYLGLLRSTVRADRRLLRDRLSHLAEGQYDLQGDVVRPHCRAAWGGEGQPQLQAQAGAAAARPERAAAAAFAKRAPGGAKAHARRALEDDD